MFDVDRQVADLFSIARRDHHAPHRGRPPKVNTSGPVRPDQARTGRAGHAGRDAAPGRSAGAGSRPSPAGQDPDRPDARRGVSRGRAWHAVLRRALDGELRSTARAQRFERADGEVLWLRWNAGPGATRPAPSTRGAAVHRWSPMLLTAQDQMRISAGVFDSSGEAIMIADRAASSVGPARPSPRSPATLAGRPSRPSGLATQVQPA